MITLLYVCANCTKKCTQKTIGKFVQYYVLQNTSKCAIIIVQKGSGQPNNRRKKNTMEKFYYKTVYDGTERICGYVLVEKIYYKTVYDGTERICGYVLAENHGDYYTITKQQYYRALKNRTVGGEAGLIFEKPVFVKGIDFD